MAFRLDLNLISKQTSYLSTCIVFSFSAVNTNSTEGLIKLSNRKTTFTHFCLFDVLKEIVWPVAWKSGEKGLFTLNYFCGSYLLDYQIITWAYCRLSIPQFMCLAVSVTFVMFLSVFWGWSCNLQCTLQI